MTVTCETARQRVHRSITALLGGDILRGRKQILHIDRKSFAHVGSCGGKECTELRMLLAMVVNPAISTNPVHTKGP